MDNVNGNWVIVEYDKKGKIKNIFRFTVSKTKKAAIYKIVNRLSKLETKYPKLTWGGLSRIGYDCRKFDFTFQEK